RGNPANGLGTWRRSGVRSWLPALTYSVPSFCWATFPMAICRTDGCNGPKWWRCIENLNQRWCWLIPRKIIIRTIARVRLWLRLLRGFALPEGISLAHRLYLRLRLFGGWI